MNLKFFRTIFVLLFVSLLTVSCSNDDAGLNPQRTTLGAEATGDSISQQDLDYLIRESQKGMSNFVHAISPYYQNGITYAQLKHNLDPQNDLKNMTTAGNNLLFQAYNYLNNDTPDQMMSGEQMVLSLKYPK